MNPQVMTDERILQDILDEQRRIRVSQDRIEEDIRGIRDVLNALFAALQKTGAVGQMFLGGVKFLLRGRP